MQSVPLTTQRFKADQDQHPFATRIGQVEREVAETGYFGRRLLDFGQVLSLNADTLLTLSVLRAALRSLKARRIRLVLLFLGVNAPLSFVSTVARAYPQVAGQI
jgi:hypothetical protein